MEKLIQTFLDLANIPSPSLKEEKVIAKIIEIFSANNISHRQDDYGNIIAQVEATDKNKKPILLSAHMDVVMYDKKAEIIINGDIIETDKTNSLGADNKAGVAAAIEFAIELKNNKELKHGGLEIVFTRDEEQGMSGINNIDFKKLNSEYALVLDSTKLGNLEISGASYTKLDVGIYTKHGGHSGIDIDKEDRLNSALILSEFISTAPTGVINRDEYGPMTSCHLATIVCGKIETALKGAVSEGNPQKYLAQNCQDNIINTRAYAHYSIRSSNPWVEKELIDAYKNIAKGIEQKYKGLVTIEISEVQHLLPFEKSDDNTLINVAKTAAKNLDISLNITTFHAGAETHVYSHKQNSSGQTFKPVLLGIADLEGLHSREERMSISSYLKGYELLKEFFVQFNN